MNTDDLLQALMNVDDKFRESLISALEDNPEELRAYVEQLESEDVPTDDGGSDDWTVVTDESAGDDGTAEAGPPEPDLTPAEETLYSVAETLNTPRTAEEVRQLINTEREELLADYSSLDNRGWISSKLNEFAKAGLVGKYRDGRQVRYTAGIEEAVRNWALKNDVFVEDLTSSHADRIVADTNMNRTAVRRAIRSLTE